jgi:sugar/nucleoside kinase (ribokinase family)
MPDVVVAGHVSFDLFPALYGPVVLEPGGLVVAGPVRFSTGGVVTNTGLALHRLGVDVRLIGRVGADLFGRAVLDALRERDPALTTHLLVCDGEATGYTLVFNPPGVDRSFVACAGANGTFTAADVPERLVAGARLFHFGYPPMMPLMYADGGAPLAGLLQSVRATGAATSLDMCGVDPGSDAGAVDWEEVLAVAMPHVDLFAPTLDELVFMLDRSALDRAAVDRTRLASLSGRLIEMGAAVVAIKLGDRGLYLRGSPERARIDDFAARVPVDATSWLAAEVFAPCFEPDVLAGTTGSGDATIAGLLAALLRGADPLAAATAATAVGACSVEAPDPTSGIPSWEQVAARIQSGWRRRAPILDLGPRAIGAAGTVVPAP